LTKISSFTTEIWPTGQKLKIQYGGRCHVELCQSGILGYTIPCMANIYQCTKFDENILICDRDMAKIRNFKNGRRHLEFIKSVNFGDSDPYVMNIYLQTKFGANRPSNC